MAAMLEGGSGYVKTFDRGLPLTRLRSLPRILARLALAGPRSECCHPRDGHGDHDSDDQGQPIAHSEGPLQLGHWRHYLSNGGVSNYFHDRGAANGPFTNKAIGIPHTWRRASANKRWSSYPGGERRTQRDIVINTPCTLRPGAIESADG